MRKRTQRRDQHSLDLRKGVLVEDHRVELVGSEAGDLEAREGCATWESGVVLHQREPLLLRRRDDLPVDDQRRRGVVVVRRDPQDRAHTPPLGRPETQPVRVGDASLETTASGARHT